MLERGWALFPLVQPFKSTAKWPGVCPQPPEMLTVLTILDIELIQGGGGKSFPASCAVTLTGLLILIDLGWLIRFQRHAGKIWAQWQDDMSTMTDIANLTWCFKFMTPYEVGNIQLHKRTSDFELRNQLKALEAHLGIKKQFYWLIVLTPLNTELKLSISLPLSISSFPLFKNQNDFWHKFIDGVYWWLCR